MKGTTNATESLDLLHFFVIRVCQYGCRWEGTRGLCANTSGPDDRHRITRPVPCENETLEKIVGIPRLLAAAIQHPAWAQPNWSATVNPTGGGRGRAHPAVST